MSSENALQKQAKQATEGLANAPLKKKIGFFSAMMVVVGSCIGAGIFFKAGNVLKYSNYSVVLAMFAWILAAFAVIAMGLALIEIASARNDNLSIIGWSQTFNGKLIYKSCKNFMVYIYLPLTYFFMPLYVVMSIQDGVSALTNATFGTSADWAIMMVIAIVMSVYFIVVCGVSSRAGNIQNWVITCVKFIPLVLAIGIGFAAFAQNGGQLPPKFDWGFKPIVPDPGTPTEPTSAAAMAATTYSFATMTPGFGLFIAVAAIFFAYDGFYVTAGIQSEMKEPKKTPLAILFGLIIVTVIYLLIAIAMSLGSTDGQPFGFEDWLKGHQLEWLYATFQILIGVGVLGIINGFALWSTRFMEDLVLADEVPFSTKFAGKINPKTPWVGIMYNLVISLPIVVIFCIIGGLGYVNATNYPNYGTGVAELYSFADLMATWTALLAFAFITFAIAGAVKNRSTGLVKVQKTSYFMPMAICTIVINAIAIFFTFFEPIANLFFLFRIPTDGWSTEYVTAIFVPRLMVVVVLFLFLALMLAPIYIEEALDKKKYGSLDNAQIERAKVMAEIKGHSLEQEILANLGIERRTILKSWEQKALNRNELTVKELNVIYGEFASEVDPVEELISTSTTKTTKASSSKKTTSSSKKSTPAKKASSSKKK